MAAKLAKAPDATGDLIFKTSGDIVVPEEVLDKTRHYVDAYTKSLEARTETYLNRLAAAGPEAAGPQLASGYQYWNVLTLGPFQAFGPIGPYRPSKIIAAGELAFMLGVVWVNPAPSPGGGLPGTTVLGSRPYRICFETINLSTVTDGPGAVIVGGFPGPAPIVTVVPWFFVPGDPGVNPNLYETTMTIDITHPAQPFAGFSTWNFDPDFEPAFLSVPAKGPEWQHDVPARYLVYKKF
jgi:hypothetical protein